MWKYSDCKECKKHTKSFWQYYGVNEITGSIQEYAYISSDFSIGNIRADPSRPCEYNNKTTTMTNLGRQNFLLDNICHFILLEICENCKAISIYDPQTMNKLYPRVSSIDDPHEDMPDNIKEIYNEARLIVDDSPRAALALNRLALDMLCDEVGATGRNLEVKIDDLGVKGILDSELVRIAHGVRGLGNGAVHPRNIDEQASKKDSEVVFALLNLITDETIAKKKRISFFSETYGKNARSK